MNPKAIYNAGSMFTEAQWNARKAEGAAMREMFPSFTILNPVDFDTNQSARPTNEQIFVKDYLALTDSKYVIFEIDGWDSGTYMEWGLIYEQALHNPEKYMFAIISDFRVQQGILKGEMPGFGLNEMISGSFDYQPLNQGDVPQLTICSSHEKARLAIKAIIENDTKNYRQRFDIREIYRDDNMYHGF